MLPPVFLKTGLCLLLLLGCTKTIAQRIELMPGTERLFWDIQWMQRFDEAGAWSLFSRTRGSVDYQGTTDWFSGVYFEYNTPLRIWTYPARPGSLRRGRC
ncbi:MAG TPA: hypothetical protein DCE41_03460 [Cytophagales bacterium]|nr:hypothetical protein [Cytophagales bacterium]HAA20962.1 hypothetical protein [Cytophagales bacterium]HAP63512.1 hypothetical protein [Cytophagales bacterium]